MNCISFESLPKLRNKSQVEINNILILIFQGKAIDLSSQFKPTYNMILSVLKGKDLKVEELLKRSFAEYEEQVIEFEKKMLCDF